MSTKKKFEDILIVGSGTGNDVAVALRNTKARIDAVEIDPLVADIGVRLHPEKPYLDTRVNLVINDARKHLGNKVFNTIIPRNVRLSEAPSHGLPAILYDINSTGSQAYISLAKEMIKRVK